MGPVIKTYGTYKPKRKGLPKYVVKETLETTRNIFSALHIDNLKTIRGGDKPKAKKITKTTTFREIKPIFDGSLDSTFDTIAKSSENKVNNDRSIIDLGTRGNPSNPDACWTCGCIPQTNMGYHAMYECKEHSFYVGYSPKKRKENKVKKTIGKDKRKKKLQLLKSPAPKSSKDATKKRCPGSKAGNPMNNLSKTPNIKDSQINKPSVAMTSTPQWCARRPKFSILSPIIADCPVEKVINRDYSLQLIWNKESIIQPVDDMSIEVVKPCKDQLEFCEKFQSVKKTAEESCNQPEVLTDNFHNEMKTSKDSSSPRVLNDNVRSKLILEDTCDVPQLLANNFHNKMRTGEDSRNTRVLNDDVRGELILDDSCDEPQLLASNFKDEMMTVEQSYKKSLVLTDHFVKRREKSSARESYKVGKKKSVVIGAVENRSLSAKESSHLMESLAVVQSPFQPRSGYITRRRIWRRTRRTVLNFSVDMFASTNKSADDSQSSDTHQSPGADRLQVVTSKNDTSLYSRKERTLAKEHFSITCDIREEGSIVKLMKYESICEKSVVVPNNVPDDSNVDTFKRCPENLNVSELSRRLKVSLDLLPSKDSEGKSVKNSCESDCDMFSELSELRSRSQIELAESESIGVSPLTEKQSSVSSELYEKHLHSTQDLSCSSPPPEQSLVFNGLMEKHSVKSLHSTQDLSCSSADESFGEKWSSSSNIDEGSNESLDIVLKPCHVVLRKCDTQTLANVMYTSQYNMDVDEDESMSYRSLNESERKRTSDLQTVVQLPLSLLGKLDSITIRSSSKLNQHSLESIVQEKRLLEKTLEKLMEISTVKETEEEVLNPNAKNLNDFKEVLSRCGQTEPLPFSSCYPESMRPKCKKIGEGAYGEVFLYTGEKQKTVIKIIPIEGDLEINAAVQKKFWEIKPEVVVAQELSSLREKHGKNLCDAFNEVLAVRCVRGKYPQWMLDLWQAYDEEQGSENDCPEVFGDDQLFVILELAHGGQDLESFQFTSADQAISAVTQIAFALAVGESEIQFEHRDLHWGNVLIAPSKTKASQFTLEGKKYKVPTKGVKVSIIDFTMSRMTMPSSGENMFYDFGHDEELFAAQGDYQCDIYRLMRERTGNNWSVYDPFTNVLWLHYLLDKMCSMVAYRNENTKLHKQAMGKLENMRDSVLAFPSATAFSSSEFFKSSRTR